MKILLLILATLALLVAVAWLIGALLPREHTATRSLVLRRSASELFGVARDLAHHSEWRHDVRTVEILSAAGAPVRYREVSGHGAIVYTLRSEEPPHRLVTAIDDPSQPFGGTWTIEFTPAGEGSTRVRITEQGYVGPALFRFLSRFVFGHTRTMENYLRHLAAKFQQPASIES